MYLLTWVFCVPGTKKKRTKKNKKTIHSNKRNKTKPRKEPQSRDYNGYQYCCLAPEHTKLKGRLFFRFLILLSRRSSTASSQWQGLTRTHLSQNVWPLKVSLHKTMRLSLFYWSINWFLQERIIPWYSWPLIQCVQVSCHIVSIVCFRKPQLALPWSLLSFDCLSLRIIVGIWKR